MSRYIETVCISHETALHAVEIAISEGAHRGISVSVTVVDPALALVAFGRADGTMPHSVETSRRKANTGASSGRPSGWMQGEFAVALPMGTDNLLTNIRGGFPLRFDGKLVGGLGIGGGTPDQDSDIAMATITAIGADAMEAS